MIELTGARLRDLLHYDPETGRFTWKVRTSARVAVGEEAGYVDERGYVRVRVDKARYPAHRLAILYMTDRWPADMVDHANGEKTDNRYANLRECDACLNNANRAVGKPSRTGIRGVRETPDGRFEVRIAAGKRRHYLGSYENLGEAQAAYEAGAKKYHGEFTYSQS